VTIKRWEAVSFLNPHIENYVTFITPTPESKPILTLVIKPFDSKIWYFIILAIVLMVLNVWLISQNNVELKKIDIKWAIISSSVRQQLPFRLPFVGSLRILFSCWLLACLILTSSYSGCFHSLMAFPSRMNTIDTIKELSIAQSNGLIQVTATKASAYFQSLKVFVMFITKMIQILDFFENLKIKWMVSSNSPKKLFFENAVHKYSRDLFESPNYKYPLFEIMIRTFVS